MLENALVFAQNLPGCTSFFQRIDTRESLVEMRQKGRIKMGTLRKIDSRMSRSKASCTETKARHEETKWRERVTSLEAVLPTLATKEDLARDVGSLRSEVHAGFGNLRSEMHQSIATLRGEMHQEFGKVRNEMAREIADVRRDMSTEFVSVRREIGAVHHDLHLLGTNLHREMHMLTWRLIGTIVTVSTALVAATHFLSNMR